MQSQIADKNKLAEKNDDTLRYTDNAIKSKDLIISECRKNIEKLEKKLNESCEETRKGNEIISLMKEDVSPC
jgi:hypothetical protein